MEISLEIEYRGSSYYRIALRSDAGVVTEDFRSWLAPERGGMLPLMKLDDRYKFVDAMDNIIPHYYS